MPGLLSYVKNKKTVDVTKWKKFSISDLFDCQLAKGDLQPKKLEQGDIPLVSAGFANNGIVTNVDKRGDGISEIFKAGSITVDMFGKTFYQPFDFFAVSHGRVNILVPKFALSQNAALFVVSVLDKTLNGKYSFSKMCSNSKLVKEYIYLPATKDGQPDWKHMEQFIAEIYTRTHTGCVKMLDFKNKPRSIDTKDWHNFTVGTLFDIARPATRSAKNYEIGTIPFVASGNVNNGIEAYINAESEQNLDKGNCITVSPLDGTSFYQEQDFAGRGGAGSSILKLYNSNLNKYNALFVCTILKKACKDFSYSKMLSAEKLSNITIKLPVSKSGDPDWKYMGQFISDTYKNARSLVA